MTPAEYDLATVEAFIGVLIYLIPMFVVAWRRPVRGDLIIILSVILGWTGIVWLICLYYSLFGERL